MVYLASDHGGFQFKEEIKSWLGEQGIAAEDLGPFKLDDGDDYPDFILPLARKVSSEPGSFGVILGRSGNGEAIAANKVKGVRAAVCLNEIMAFKARNDNNANILSLPADYIGLEDAKKVVKKFLETPFSGAERHMRRLQKISHVEESHE